MRRPRPARPWIPLALLALAACSAPPPPGEVAEESVKPGINEPFLGEGFEVEAFVERFEREGREVFDKRQEIVDAIGLEPGMDVADIGAGTGLFTPILAEAVGPEGTVFAQDIQPAFLEFIDRRMREAGFRNCKTLLGSAKSTGLSWRSIDVAFLCDVYHHFEYPKNTLASLRHALRPGGELILVDFERIDGESSDWILNHVRAGKEVFLQEIVDAGFELVEEKDLLETSYWLRFRRLPD